MSVPPAPLIMPLTSRTNLAARSQRQGTGHAPTKRPVHIHVPPTLAALLSQPDTLGGEENRRL